MNLLPIVLFVIVNHAMVRLVGELGLAVVGIVNTLLMLTSMPVWGIMQGAAPIMGYNPGAGSVERVWRVFF